VPSRLDPRQVGSEAIYAKKIVKVLDSEMEVLVSEPEGKGPHLGLIVCQHILVTHVGLGRDPSQIGIGERLAAAGYVVAIP